MRVLIVASYNKGFFAPFIVDQVESLQKIGVEVDYFGIVGKGFKGYLSSFSLLKAKISAFNPDIIHAHYGLSGLLANLQRKVPVITTYHGSDVNDKNVRLFSKLAMLLSKHNIFVSQKNVDIMRPKRNFSLLPCGVNMENFSFMTKAEARTQLHWNQESKIVIFAGAFDNQVKNATLAKRTIELLENVELKELKGYSRSQVAAVFYAADCLLMTSFSEGSPQVVKEALVCGCPVVSVDVGDVKERVQLVNGCFVSTNYDEVELARGIKQSFEVGRVKCELDACFDNKNIALELMRIYKS